MDASDRGASTAVVPTSNGNTSIKLSANADVKFLFMDCEGRLRHEIRVSSSILSMVSPAFAQLLAVGVNDEQHMSKTGMRYVRLPADDYESMKTLLQILHHDVVKLTPPTTLQDIAIFAIVSDHYDCLQPVKLWILQWMNSMDTKTDTALSIGYRLLIAATIGAEHVIRETTAFAVKSLQPGALSVWQRAPLLVLLPDGLKERIEQETDVLILAIRTQIQASDSALLKKTGYFTMKTIQCCMCGRVHSPGTKKCHNCAFLALRPADCSMRTRLGDYFLEFRIGGLWPFECTSVLSPHEFLERSKAILTNKKHLCSGGAGCPVVETLGAMCADIDRMLSDCQGFAVGDLTPVKSKSELK